VNKILKVLVVLPAILFIITGLRWWLAPAGVAPMFGLVLADGRGLSSQVGDMSSYFLTLGTCMLIAVISGRRSWFYPPALLLLLTAVGRTLAWLLHDATPALDLIGLELVVAAILLLASRRLAGTA
jgi:hypothetical protein